jgi:uncharacterized glyoxalase superfamily protein PhnB
MKPTPEGWPRISASLFYDDAAAAIDWLVSAFGFEVRLRVEGEGGRIEHSELTLGEGLIMVSTAGRHEYGLSPKSVDGANTQTLCIYVDDADAHCEHSRAAGATIAMEPQTNDYGDDYWADRSYQAVDPEGHRWWFLQRVRNPGE